MAKKRKIPVTPAIRALRRAGVEFTAREYAYVEHGGSRAAAEAFGTDEHSVVKTIVLADETGAPVMVLMHGDKEVSTKELAREMGVKSYTPVDPKTANLITGYQVGGISPFGTRKSPPVAAEETIFELDLIRINAGKRGMLVEMDPRDIEKVVEVKRVKVAI